MARKQPPLIMNVSEIGPSINAENNRFRNIVEQHENGYHSYTTFSGYTKLLKSFCNNNGINNCSSKYGLMRLMKLKLKHLIMEHRTVCPN